MTFKPGLKLFLIVSFAFIGSACSMLTKINEGANKKFVVNPFWVQDTLAQPNPAFRKVNRMTPVLYKNSIIVGNALDGLVSYDLSSKNEKWRLPIAFGVEAGSASINDRLFVGSNSGVMYSVNMINGETVWTFDTKSELVSEPLLQNGVLYFLSGSQSLYALDASNGKQLWTYNRQDTTSHMTIRGGSKPAIANGIVYVGFSDGSLVAINANTGTQQWEITLNRNAKFKDIDASPVVDGDYIYINSYDDKLYCLSKDKGEIIWNVPYGGFSTPLVLDDKIYVTSSRGEIAALSKLSGNAVWVKTTNSGIFIEPQIFNSMIVAGESQGKLVFFNKDTGEKHGEFEPGRGVFSRPVVSKDSLYFISGEGNIYGINARYEYKSSIYYLK